MDSSQSNLQTTAPKVCGTKRLNACEKLHVAFELEIQPNPQKHHR